MARGYEVFRKGNEPSKTFDVYDRGVRTLVEKLPDGMTYQWKFRGDKDWRSAPSKPALKEKLLSKSLQVGEAIYARRKGGVAIFVLNCVEVMPPLANCPDPDATSGVKELWDALQVATYQAEMHFGRSLDFVFMGIYNCRRIDGSNTWSQHAFRNAVDFRIRRTDGETGSIDQQATTFVVNKVDDLAAEALWLVSGHYFHAHLTGRPKRTGTPACA